MIMKILLVSERFYPQVVGSGTSAYLIAKELLKLGHEVSIATDESVKKLLGKEKLPFDMFYIRCFEEYIMGKSSFQKPLTDLYSVLKSNKFDVIQVNNFMPMLLFTLIKPLVKSPVVFTFHNTPYGMKRAIGCVKDSDLDIQLAKTIISSKKYEYIVNGSKNYSDFAKKLGADKKKMETVYLGIDQDEFKKNLKKYKNININQYFDKPIEAGDFLITLPARITPTKGIEEAIIALSKINDKKVKLLLTNMVSPFNPEYASYIFDKIKKLKLTKRVIVPNKVIPRFHLGSIYLRSNLIITPSHYEGLGLSAIEALLSNRPLIATNIPGLNEIVKNNFNGLLVPKEKPNLLAKAILRIKDSKSLVEEFSKNAVNSVKKFEIKNHAKVLEEIYLKEIRKWKE